MRRALAHVLLLALLAIPVARVAQEPVSTDLNRLFAAARRAGLQEADLLPVLDTLGQLQAQSLPTGRYVEKALECMAKGCAPAVLAERAKSVAGQTQSAGRLVRELEDAGLKGGAVPGGDNPVEDLADTLQTAPLTAADLAEIRKALKTDQFQRVLAGADAFAHLGRQRVEAPAAFQLLSAAPAKLPDRDLRFLPRAFCMGRRAGLQDAEIQKALVRGMAKGASPYDLMQEWAQEAGYRGPGCGPGPGRGHGRGQGQGQGMGSGQGAGQGSGQGWRGGSGSPQGPGGSGGSGSGSGGRGRGGR
jgi:hypothetical protein